MKKVVSLLAVLFLFAGLSFAKVSSTDTIKQFYGFVDFSEKGNFYFDFNLYNIADINQENPKSTTTINWNSNYAFNSSSETTKNWVRANQYAVVTSSSANQAGCIVYMYQENTKSTVFKAVAPRLSDDGKNNKTRVFSGLVRQGSEQYQTENGGDYGVYVPIAYVLQNTKSSNVDFGDAIDASHGIYKGNSVYLSTPTSSRADRYITDKADCYANNDDKYTINTSSSAYKQTYAIIGATDAGVVYGYDDTKQAPWGHVGTSYMYFFGGFSQIQPGTYGTDRLYIETHIE